LSKQLGEQSKQLGEFDEEVEASSINALNRDQVVVMSTGGNTMKRKANPRL
jgi:hypothetical protein